MISVCDFHLEKENFFRWFEGMISVEIFMKDKNNWLKIMPKNNRRVLLSTVVWLLISVLIYYNIVLGFHGRENMCVSHFGKSSFLSKKL